MRINPVSLRTYRFGGQLIFGNAQFLINKRFCCRNNPEKSFEKVEGFCLLYLLLLFWDPLKINLFTIESVSFVKFYFIQFFLGLNQIYGNYTLNAFMACHTLTLPIINSRFACHRRTNERRKKSFNDKCNYVNLHDL